MDIVQENCQVCALGACLLSKARVFDDLPFLTIKDPAGSKLGDIYVTTEPVYNSLSDILGFGNALLIECAYQRSDMAGYTDVRGLGSDGVSKKKILAAVAFGRKFQEPQDSLKAIMENVIENNGVFIPEESN